MNLPVSFTINDDAPASISNFAEIASDSGDDCDSTPDTTNGNGSGESNELDDNQIGSGCQPGGDEDDHDIETIAIVEPAYDLALVKTLASTGPFNTGDSVTFTITVENQGTIDSGEIQIIDYIPRGLTLSDASWAE